MIRITKVQVTFEFDRDELLKAIGHAFNGGFFYGDRSKPGVARSKIMAGLREFLVQNGTPMDDPELNEYADRQVRAIARRIVGDALAYRV